MWKSIAASWVSALLALICFIAALAADDPSTRIVSAVLLACIVVDVHMRKVNDTLRAIEQELIRRRGAP